MTRECECSSRRLTAEFNSDQPVVRAILGGTGRYIGARGQLTSTRKNDGSYTQVFTNGQVMLIENHSPMSLIDAAFHGNRLQSSRIVSGEGGQLRGKIALWFRGEQLKLNRLSWPKVC